MSELNQTKEIEKSRKEIITSDMSHKNDNQRNGTNKPVARGGAEQNRKNTTT